MRKLILAVFTATVFVSLLSGAASARTGLRAEPRSTYVYLHNLRLEGGIAPVKCDVTMGVELHTSIPKAAGTLAGFATIAVSTGACEEGDAGLLVGGRRVTGLQGPYHVNYLSFTGTLPRIEAVTLQVLAVEFWIREPRGVECLTNGSQNITGTTTGGNPATGISVAAQNIPLRGGILCLFAQGSMEGTGGFYRELARAVATSVQISLI
jgi:hypothetical protein